MTTTGETMYDGFVATTGEELWSRLHQAQRRFAALLTVTPAGLPVPGSDWTAGEVAKHVLTVLRRYTQRDLTSTAGLSPDGAGVRDQNALELTAIAGLPLAEVLDQIWQEVVEIERLLPPTVDLHQRLPFHGGQEMDVAAALGNLIGEFLLHGRDVARASGRRWQIGSRNAALAMNLGVQAAPAYVVDGAADLAVEIRTPETNPWILDLVGGQLTSRPAGHRERVDVRVYARSEPLLLNLYGRIGMARATAGGTLVTGGRRPWRITRLPATFLTP